MDFISAQLWEEELKKRQKTCQHEFYLMPASSIFKCCKCDKVDDRKETPDEQ